MNSGGNDIRKQHILVVEDEFTTRLTLASYFEAAGFRVSAVENGDKMWDVLRHGGVDVILLDILLPGKDGLTLLREIRAVSDIGIIMVTGRADEVDQIVGLEGGADHYVVKPFNPRDLLARVRAVLRRLEDVNRAGPLNGARRFVGWTIDFGNRTLLAPDCREIRLTAAEFKLLSALVQNPHRIMTRDALLEHVATREWAPGDRSIDVMIGRLRKKIEDDPANPRIILTEHGIGYRFGVDVVRH